ncbi:MAG: FimB/Mfa2 family fimbrial subunit, partial [Candidatus Symbiothrix sp.]|nr:FimB/Mfa2 family fimbrial subunit [Candidatus Symbiothrix sp.]
MKKSSNIRTHGLYLLIGLLTVSSCSQEDLNVKTNLSGGQQEVVINLSVPFEFAQPQLRSMDRTAEEKIDCIDVLIFDKDDQLDTIVEGRIIKPKELRATLPFKNNMRLVLIANAHEQVRALQSSLSTSSVRDKKTLLAKLEFSALNSDGSWNTSEGYTRFPMWGEASTLISVTPATSGTVPVATISLLRMIAKIDVEVSGGAVNKFKLKNVRLYNYVSKGRIVPDSVKVTDNQITVTAPTLPVDYTQPSAPVFTDYTDFSAPGVMDKAMRGVIYAFETKAPDISEPSDAACLVVGGEFEETMSYYRIDFWDKTKEVFLPLLRNNHYVVKITNVMGRGYATPEEAFKNKGVNVAYDILQWNEDVNADIKNVIFDNYYYLGISRDAFQFAKGAITENKPTNLLKIKTNYPGWSVESTNPSWLNLSKHNPSSTAEDVYLFLTPYSFGASGESTPETEREAQIIIRAGRLHYSVSVIQHRDIEPVSIEITTLEGGTPTPIQSYTYNFNKLGDANKGLLDFDVRWTPASFPLFIYKTVKQGVDFVEWGSSPILTTITSGTGEGSFRMSSPAVLDVSSGYYHKAERILFQVSNGIDTVEDSL